MAGTNASLLVWFAGAGQFSAVAAAEVSPGDPPLLQHNRVHSDGDRHVLPHVSTKGGRGRRVHLRAASRAVAGDRSVTAIRLLCALCVCLLIVQGCRRPTQSTADLTLAHEVSPQPPRVGPATITLKAVAGAQITLEGNMSHAGMVPVLAEAREVEPGSYRATMEL